MCAFKFYKSPEAVNEYLKIGQEYPDHINDLMFRHHHQLIDWDPNKKEVINSLTRVKTFDDSEYLVYSDTSEGVDKIYGRRHTFYRSNVGRYLKIETQKTRIPNPDFVANPSLEYDLNDSNGGKARDYGAISPYKEVTNVVGETEAYSLPFTKANLEELRKKCNDKTRYSVAKESGQTVLVNNFESFRDGDFEQLFNYGGVLDKSERNRIDNMNRLRQTAQTTKVMEAIV